jgi:NAD(P)-dependent dehydrogenase (short-subunit alcohol dehydrogenase family)
MISFDLDGKRALVIGAASGIGFVTAERLADGGARVAMNDLPTPALALAIEQLRERGLSVEPVAGELGVSATAGDVGRRAFDVLGDLDYLVNNADVQPISTTPGSTGTAG